ncbi:MAG: hypothetical protein EZS28_045130, partial [Streblomastix strix]
MAQNIKVEELSPEIKQQLDKQYNETLAKHGLSREIADQMDRGMDNIIARADQQALEFTSLTINERILHAKTNLYYYNKIDYGTQGKKITGSCINIAKVPYLAVVDIDINKSLDDEQRKIVRDELLEQLKKDT